MHRAAIAHDIYRLFEGMTASAAAQLVQITITVDQLQLEQEYDRRKTHHVHAASKPKDAAFNADSSNRQSGGRNRNQERAPGQKKELRC